MTTTTIMGKTMGMATTITITTMSMTTTIVSISTTIGLLTGEFN